MNLSELRGATDCTLEVNPELWAWATLLGEARRTSNDGVRSREADRGDSTNRGVDLAGAFGELFLYQLVRQFPKSDLACRYIAERLFVPGGGTRAKGPDLKFAEDDTKTVIGVDSKTFSNPRYNFFAINAEKHNELRGLCSFYFCLCFAGRSRSVAVAKLVPYEDVDRWEIRDLGGRGDLSRNLPIQTFVNGYYQHPFNVRSFPATSFSAEEIEALTCDQQVRRRLCELVPTLRL